VIGGEACRKQGLEQVLDLTQADPGGEGDGGHLSELGRVAQDRPIGSSGRCGELIAELLILGEEFGRLSLSARGVELLFDPASLLVDGLTAAAGLLGPASDGSVGPGEDGGGVADGIADR
jgi:hypothetical protein